MQFCDPWPPAGSSATKSTLLSISLDEATLIADAYALWLHGAAPLSRAGLYAQAGVRPVEVLTYSTVNDRELLFMVAQRGIDLVPQLDPDRLRVC